MKNRSVGLLIIGVAILIGFIIYTFNRAMTDIINASCSHGPECAMWGTIDFQTNLSLGVMVFVMAIGVYLVFFGRDEKIVTRIRKINHQVVPKKPTRANYRKIIETLSADEKKVLESVIDAEGSIYQSELINKTGYSKVKTSRILDRLEGKKIIERRRRGMTNMVMLSK